MNTDSGMCTATPLMWALFRTFSFVCQIALPRLGGNEKLNLRYTNNELNSARFDVWYSYAAASKQLLDNWEDKWMTGFKFSWMIGNENPPLIANITEIGRTIRTPRIRGNDHRYKVILTLLKNLEQKDVSLVIQLDANLTGTVGQTEELVAFTDFKLYETKKTFDDAEASCGNHCGQLASIHSKWEQALADKARDGNAVWLGGKNTAKGWKWVDNSTWNFTNWRSGCPNKNGHLMMGDGGLWCNAAFSF